MVCGAQATGRPLFDDFSTVAERVGVYTASDYADIMEHLIKRWEVEGRELSGEAAEAQVYLYAHSRRRGRQRISPCQPNTSLHSLHRESTGQHTRAQRHPSKEFGTTGGYHTERTTQTP
jgi:hypothetical protein